jgi:hypothetical protein
MGAQSIQGSRLDRQAKRAIEIAVTAGFRSFSFRISAIEPEQAFN